MPILCTHERPKPTTRSCNNTTCIYSPHTQITNTTFHYMSRKHNTQAHYIRASPTNTRGPDSPSLLFPFAVAFSQFTTPPGGTSGLITTKNKHRVCQYSLYQTYWAVPGGVPIRVRAGNGIGLLTKQADLPVTEPSRCLRFCETSRYM
jgi:hypothetical protein